MRDDRPLRLATPPADDRPADVAGPSPLLVDARCLAAMLAVSLRKLRAMDARGQIPAPVRVGNRAVRWRYAEVLAWLAAGCPPRQAWEAARRARS